MLERAVRIAREAQLAPVIPVLNPTLIADTALVNRLYGLGAHPIENMEAEEGMASSVRCGLAEVRDDHVQGVVLMTCDQVAMTVEHIRALFCDPDEIAASSYGGRIGVPAYFPAHYFAELLSLRGDQGARALLQTARVVTRDELALDIDTEEQWVEAKAWLLGAGKQAT